MTQLANAQNNPYQNPRKCRSPGSRPFVFAVAAALILSVGCARRLGHNVEDIEYISSGALNGHVVVLDGYDVYSAAPGDPPSSQSLERQFDLRGTGVTWGPRGVAHISDEDVFVFNNPREIDELLLTDAQGNPRPAIEITYLGDTPYHTEGLAYVPEGEPRFGGKLLLAAIWFGEAMTTRILVIDRDGVVSDEIALEPPYDENWIGAVEYLPGGELLISQGGDALHRFDLDGNLLAGPTLVEGPGSIEGVAVTEAGYVVAAGYYGGKLPVLGPALEPVDEATLHHDLGEGVSFPLGLTYRPDQDAFVMQHVSLDGFGFVAVEKELGAVQPQFVLDSDVTNLSSLAWIPGDKLFAVLRVGAGELWMVDAAGTVVEKLDLSLYGPLREIDYIPSWDQFVLVSAAEDEQTALHFLDRAGRSVGRMDLGGGEIESILSLAVAETPFGPTFVVADAPEFSTTMAAFDSRGDRLWSRDYREAFNVMHPDSLTAFREGMFTGLAAADSGSSEIVLFHPLMD
ncbi:MAG: hypothetical protein B7733_23285 [Myxococcales bacterium FL481]|nr:MAG: hypothetical protein B7733_23285 [Myxococcales bacterium FL481]